MSVCLCEFYVAMTLLRISVSPFPANLWLIRKMFMCDSGFVSVIKSNKTLVDNMRVCNSVSEVSVNLVFFVSR